MDHPPPPAVPPGAYGPEWQNSLFDCSPCSSCLLGCCLPCVLLGRTTSRMQDPGVQYPDGFNGDCLLFGLVHCFTGCGFLYNIIKRREIRDAYGIEGSGLGDCCTSYFCLCCALIQQDNEVKLRAAAPRPPITQGYQSHKEGMQMPAPAYQPQQHQQQPIQQQPIQQQPMQ